MSLDLHPRNFPGYRPLLQQLAELWEPSSTTESTPTTTTPATTPADLAANIAALRSEVAELRARVAELERVAASAPLPAPPPSPKPPKPPYVDVSQATADERWNVWVLVYGDPRYACLPPSCAQDMFARHSALSCREFRRWFSAHRTHAPNSPQDMRFRKRISEALERLPTPCVTQ
jgi:hypothetical protein